MKGQTDKVFLIALGIGLVIIALAYMSVYRPLNILQTKKTTTPIITPKVPETKGVIQDYPTAGIVGIASELAATTKKFPMFNASHLDEEVLFGNFSGRVFNGLLYGKRDAVIIANLNHDRARILFRIESTNGYGRLMVIANNCTLADRKFGIGEHEVELPEDCTSNETKIRLHASSSAWRIWAPTVYDISQLEVAQRMFVDRPAHLEFSIPEDIYDSLDKAYLTLVLPFHEGNISVEVNGRKIAERPSEDDMIFRIKPEDLRQGMNEIVIRVSSGGYVRGTAELELYHYLDREKAVEKTFYIDSSKYKKLEDGGEIRLFVSKVYRSGGMSVVIRDSRNSVRFKAYLPVRYGAYSIPIYQGNVSSDMNTVTIKSIDNSVFVVDSLEVVV